MQQAQRLIGIAGQLFESEIEICRPKYRCHVFHLVRFVEYHRRVSGRMLPKSSCLCARSAKNR